MSAFIPAWVDGALRPVEKLEVHFRGLRHKAVSVFVLCGDPDWGESDEDCAQRRLAEELGVTGLKLTQQASVEYRADVGGGLIEHEVVSIFRARAATRMPLAPDPNEVMDTKWIRIGRLIEETQRRPAIFTPWLVIYLQRHFEPIFA
jgi:isopentenyl-diphosphate delta-isomerase